MKHIYRPIIIITLLICTNVTMSSQDKVFNYKPIGIFHTPYTPDIGAPRQGILMPEGKAEIEIYDEYRDGLSALNLFEYVIVLYHFDKVNSWDPIVEPPGSSHDHRFGVFSTRSPKRPNPIGFAIVKLEKINQGVLYVTGIDAFDGTPVLDIKPYLPSIDYIKSIQNEMVEKELGHHDEKFINDSSFYK